MSESKSRKAIRLRDLFPIGRYIKLSPEELPKSPRNRYSIDWASTQLEQYISTKLTSISILDDEALLELKGDITNIKTEINNNTNLLKTNNDLLLELLNLLKLQASQAYFWS